MAPLNSSQGANLGVFSNMRSWPGTNPVGRTALNGAAQLNQLASFSPVGYAPARPVGVSTGTTVQAIQAQAAQTVGRVATLGRATLGTLAARLRGL